MKNPNFNSKILDQARLMLVEANHIVSRQQERSRLLGEEFNLFEILRVGHYEVTTHSRLIAELLDPAGRHGQGALFLEAFLDTFGLEGKIDPKSAKVYTERYLGPKTKDSGGRIDILIEDGAGRKIAIENKIYAADQEDWAVRYANALQPDDTLIYLTLDVREVDEGEKALVKEKCGVSLISKSYRDDIIAWLELAHGKAASLPIVRETLIQYRNLVKNLTHQNSSSVMNEQLVELARNNLASFFALAKAEGAVKELLTKKLNESLKAATDQGGRLEDLEMIHQFDEGGAKWGGVLFTNEELRKENVTVGIMFQKDRWKQLLYGFSYIDHNASHHMEDSIQKAFSSEFGNYHSTEWWSAYSEYPRSNWDTKEFEDIENGKFADELVKKISRLKEVFSKAKEASSKADEEC